MMLEEAKLNAEVKLNAEMLNAKQISHNAKQEVDRLTSVNQILQADVDRLPNFIFTNSNEFLDLKIDWHL